MLLPSLRPDSKTSFQPFRLGFFLLVPPPPSPCALGRPSTRGKKRRGGGGLKGLLDSTDASRESSKSPPLPLLRLQKRHPSPKRGGGREAQEKADQPSRQGEQEEGFSSQCACVRLLLLSLSLSPQPFFCAPPLFSCSPLEPFSSSSSPFLGPLHLLLHPSATSPSTADGGGGRASRQQERERVRAPFPPGGRAGRGRRGLHGSTRCHLAPEGGLGSHFMTPGTVRRSSGRTRAPWGSQRTRTDQTIRRPGLSGSVPGSFAQLQLRLQGRPSWPRCLRAAAETAAPYSGAAAAAKAADPSSSPLPLSLPLAPFAAAQGPNTHLQVHNLNLK